MGHGLILTNCHGLLDEKSGLGAGTRRSADFTLENSGNGAGKEELRSRRRLSDNAKKLAEERERNDTKEGNERQKVRKDEKMKSGSERGIVNVSREGRRRSMVRIMNEERRKSREEG